MLQHLRRPSVQRLLWRAMPIPRSVLRMTDEELEAFLASERTARVGTVSPNGERRPHRLLRPLKPARDAFRLATT